MCGGAGRGCALVHACSVQVCGLIAVAGCCVQVANKTVTLKNKTKVTYLAYTEQGIYVSMGEHVVNSNRG